MSDLIKKRLRELSERLEKATGPDRQLGVDIRVALGTLEVDENGYFVEPDDGYFFGQRIPCHEDPTASIDAALALFERLLPEMKPRLDFDARSRCCLYRETGMTIGAMAGDWSFYAEAETIPIAILRALVAALITKETK